MRRGQWAGLPQGGFILRWTEQLAIEMRWVSERDDAGNVWFERWPQLVDATL